ncbi:MAG: molybdate transport system ATP-binding protein [Saprospiraceae bacterium]|jgi:molybdate transport system ATP-binding protein
MIEIAIKKELNGASGSILLDVELILEKGSLTTLYSPSGAGKTSILRMIAGLMIPDEGAIKVNDDHWFSHAEKVNISPQKRRVGLVFQDYALFPNMTILENLKYAQSRLSSNSIISEIIEITELGTLQDRLPSTLSGGQKQRVALARALVQRPEILLLDEPLSALDQDMRTKLQRYILDAHKQFGLTTILVSHDIGEVFKMSDIVVVLDEGQIIKCGSPIEVFSNKKVSGKFQFTGEVLGIQKQGFIYILSIFIGNDIVKVIAEETEANNFIIGDKVLVASKAFNPIELGI